MAGITLTAKVGTKCTFRLLAENDQWALGDFFDSLSGLTRRRFSPHPP
jgi:hypothetical protein